MSVDEAYEQLGLKHHEADCPICGGIDQWATMKEQANNTRRTNYVIHDGRRVNLMDIQAATGIHPETLRARIRKGWSYDKIIGTPLKATLRERDDYGQFI